MRALTHLFAVILAVTLVFKPCASAVAAHLANDQAPANAVTSTIGVDEKTPCISKCLKARTEVRREFEPKASPRGKPLPVWAIAEFAVPSATLSVRFAGPADTATDHRVRPARSILHMLCRQLI